MTKPELDDLFENLRTSLELTLHAMGAPKQEQRIYMPWFRPDRSLVLGHGTGKIATVLAGNGFLDLGGCVHSDWWDQRG